MQSIPQVNAQYGGTGARDSVASKGQYNSARDKYYLSSFSLAGEFQFCFQPPFLVKERDEQNFRTPRVQTKLQALAFLIS